LRVYQTGQRKCLLGFLKDNADKQYTIEEIAGYMTDGDMPGKSTLYRLMARLVDEGHVKRIVKGNSRKFVYQYLNGEHCSSHLHLNCMVCGQLIHLDDEESRNLRQQLLKYNRFEINEAETVISGVCEKCRV
jgi:Fur family ferric uptake transcriptional regulator